MSLIPNFINTVDYLKELHRKKNDDYSGDRGSFFNFDFSEQLSSYFTSYHMGFVYMIGIKLARLSVLLVKSTEPNNESIEDTFNDLINYCIIWKCKYTEMKKQREPISQARVNGANSV